MNDLAAILSGWGSAATVGLLLGLASGLHCVAMCGAFALHAGGAGSAASRTARVALWSLGRTTTYVGLGLLVARVGQAGLDALAGGREVLLFVTGVAIAVWGLRLVLGAFGKTLPRLPMRAPGRLVAAWTAALGPLRSEARGPYALGLLNGLLPCGMTGTALLAAASRPGPIAAGALMAGFGLATIPALWLTSCAGPWARGAWSRPATRAAVGALVVALGVSFSGHSVRSWTSAPSGGIQAPCPLCTTPSAP